MQQPTPKLLIDVLLWVEKITRDGIPYDFNYQDCRIYTDHPVAEDIREAYIECIQYELFSTEESEGFLPIRIPPIKGLTNEGFIFLGFLCQDNVAKLPAMKPGQPGSSLAQYYLCWIENDTPLSAVLEQSLLTCIKNAPWGRPIYIDKEARAKSPLKDYTLAETIYHFNLNVSKRHILGGELSFFPRPTIGQAKLTITGKQYLTELDAYYGCKIYL